MNILKIQSRTQIENKNIELISVWSIDICSMHSEPGTR